jgi:nucleoside-diphosphate-sugar epimerase
VKRVVVTGARGFIGREALAPLRAAGFETHILGREKAESAPEAIYHHCDLLSDAVAPLVRAIAPSHLLHLAWYTAPGRFWNAPENLDWVAASLRLVRGFAASGGRRLVAAGSCAEYDWSREWMDEAATPLTPDTLYGLAKAALFGLIDKGAPTLGLSVAWGRIFFPYGPFEKPGRLLGDLFDGLGRGETVPLSEGRQERDFMHVEDVAAAFVRLLDSDLEGPVNIATGETLAVRDIAVRAARIAGGEHLLRFGARPMQPAEPSRMAASVARLQTELGFTPKHTVDSGLRDMFRRRFAGPPDKSFPDARHD